MTLIDLHLHTRRYSPCSLLSPDELLVKAVKLGLSGLVITEHNYRWEERELEALRQSLKIPPDFLLLSGQEVDTDLGHILVYGYKEKFAPGISWLELLKKVEAAGACTVLAHAFRWSFPGSPEERPEFLSGFTAVEVLNGNLSPEQIKRGRAIARSLALKTTGGSDAHSIEMVGKYLTGFEKELKNEADLLAALRSGKYKPVSRTP